MKETHTEMLRDMLHVIGWVRDDMVMESCLLLDKYMTCQLTGESDVKRHRWLGVKKNDEEVKCIKE